MIDGLKPYPAVKHSGVPWLGEVPAHWEVATLRRYLRPFDGIKIGPFGSQLKLDQMSGAGYKVYGQANVIARDFARGSKFVDQKKFEELSACEVRPGDLVVTMMGTSGRCARVPDSAVPGIMDSHLLRLRTSGGIDARFTALVIDESPYVKEQIAIAGKGSIMHGLNSSMVKDLVLALPSLPEQFAIVRYLHHADRRSRRYIHAKQKLIKLLEEQKQAIIHRAVTGQIDVRTGQPYPAYKPSGVEWLADVPEHWEVIALRYLGTKFGSGVTPKGGAQVYEVEGVPFLRSQNVHFSGLRLEGVARISRALHDTMGATHVRPLDVLLNITGASIGRVCAVPADFVEGNVNQHVCIIRPRHTRMDSAYLAAFLSTPGIQTEIYLSQNGSSREGLTLQAIRDLRVLVPPSEEQKAIVNWIQEQTKKLDIVVAHTENEIALLREYRIRLIADVVTGKLDVREAAARLPDEAEEPEAPGDVETPAEGEEATDGDLDTMTKEAET